MKNKLVFRILGAIASALIIASVFLPFISVTGYSQSLWQAHDSVGTLYLPIMIIVFGLIGVVFFSINIKTELAYTSSGALLFFLIMQTIPVINQGTFSTLSVGYYSLAVGTIVTGVMAFICNLRIKVKEKKEVLENKPEQQVSMINQIDKLYNSNGFTQSYDENNSLDSIIQPLPLQNPTQNSFNSIQDNSLSNSPIMFENEIQLQPITMNNSNNVTGDVSLHNLNTNDSVVQVNMQPTVTLNNDLISSQNSMTMEPNQSVNNNVTNQVPIQNMQSPNPVISEFSVPVVNDMNNQGLVQNVATPNPVVSEFSVPVVNGMNNQGLVQNVATPNPVISEFSQPINQNNPVVAEFGNFTHNSQFITQNNDTQVSNNEQNGFVNLQTLGPSSTVSPSSNQQNTNLDIFN